MEILLKYTSPDLGNWQTRGVQKKDAWRNFAGSNVDLASTMRLWYDILVCLLVFFLSICRPHLRRSPL